MEADVILNGNTIQLKGNVDVTASEQELDVNGPLAGYAFHDRSSPGTRFVLYADKGKVFLWKDGIGNIITIEGGVITPAALVAKQVFTGQLIVKGSSPTGSALVRWDESIPVLITKDGKPAPPRIVEMEMDLVKTIQELQATIRNLENRLHAAETKLGIAGPIKIGH